MVNSYFNRVGEVFQRQAFKEFYSRHFSGKFSPYLAAACVGSPITPNALTLLMIPAGLVGAAFFIQGTSAAYLIGGSFFVLLNILDAADGELARYTQRTSLFGDYLDRIAHYCTNAAAVLGLGIGLAEQTGHEAFFYLALLATAAIVGDDAMRDLLVTCGVEQRDSGEDRKAIKKRSKLVLPRAVSLPGEILLSNVALFHVIPLLAAAQLASHATWIVATYYLAFVLTQAAKTLVRGRKIYVMHA